MKTINCFMLVLLEGLLSLTVCVGLQYRSANVSISGVGTVLQCAHLK